MKATKVPLSHGGHSLHDQLPPCLLLSLGCQAVHGSNLAFASCLLPLEWQGSASPFWVGRAVVEGLEKQSAGFFFHPQARKQREMG